LKSYWIKRKIIVNAKENAMSTTVFAKRMENSVVLCASVAQIAAIRKL
jgi:hypothetical protein